MLVGIELKIHFTAEFSSPFMPNNTYVLSGKFKVLVRSEKDQNAIL